MNITMKLTIDTSYWVHALASLLVVGSADEKPCIPRKYDQDSIVCVCNATYCDDVGITTPPPYFYYNAFTTSLDGQRLKRDLGSFQVKPVGDAEIGNHTYQEIVGFGGAFTDAATMTIKALSEAAQQKLINSYFHPTGIEYTLGRIPMASCDFSKRIYSYDDVTNDLSLTHFKLADEDLQFKIPVIKAALNVSKRQINFFGSPWSSPAWMKSNNNMTGKGSIKGQPGGEYFKSWALYFVRFLQEYQKQNITIWGLTAQNEPSDGMIEGFPFQCLGWTGDLQRDFIKTDLGPALVQSGFKDVKLMILDDQRVFLPFWAETVLHDSDAAKYVSGIAVHWYEDLFVPTSALERTYEQFGAKYFMINTEACEQDLINKNRSVLLGNWYRGERYFRDIMQDMRHKVSAWVDWNIALDLSGGPNWQDNRADSPIIVNASADEFYKQPMYYAMGHFSKFVVPGSKMIKVINTYLYQLDLLAFLRPDNSIALMVGNYEDIVEELTIYDPKVFGYIIREVPPKSFMTLVWYRK